MTALHLREAIVVNTYKQLVVILGILYCQVCLDLMVGVCLASEAEEVIDFFGFPLSLTLQSPSVMLLGLRKLEPLSDLPKINVGKAFRFGATPYPDEALDTLIKQTLETLVECILKALS